MMETGGYYKNLKRTLILISVVVRFALGSACNMLYDLGKLP